MSLPRLCFSDNVSSITRALSPHGISPVLVTGAFWGQSLTGGIADMLEEHDVILACDYDSVFPPSTVTALLAVMVQSGYDAVAPLQVRRRSGSVMFSQPGALPGDAVPIEPHWFDEPVRPVDTAHFGCTLMRTSIIRKMEKPWFNASANQDGEWNGGHEDEDLCFWRKFREAGGRLGVTPNISIGHAELMVTWPSTKSGTGVTRGNVTDFWNTGAPADAHGVVQ